MKLRIWDWIWTCLGHPCLQIPYATGWIAVDPRDWLQGEIFRHGGYEPEVWDALAAFAEGDEVVWDVGAQIGSFSVRAMLDPRVREVQAFEPNPAQVEVLRFNLALNPGRGIVHPLALSDREETLRLSPGLAANTGLAALSREPTQAGVPVRCQTIDQVVFEENLPAPTLMKIDVEGWERPVLEGAKRLLAERPPKAIAYEAECDLTGEVTDAALHALIHSAGYSVRRIRRPSGLIDTRENYLAVRA